MEKVLRAKDMVRVKDLRAKELLRVKVTLKKTSGEIWIETEPLLVHCTMGHIVFDLAGVRIKNSLNFEKLVYAGSGYQKLL